MVAWMVVVLEFVLAALKVEVKDSKLGNMLGEQSVFLTASKMAEKLVGCSVVYWDYETGV